MAIKVKLSQGQTEAKSTALHQWDYGQVLEIESPELPTIVEVHFACRSMTEAVRHVCSVDNGVAVVAIPNRCLEQSENITAWVYEISGSTGTTIMTITIPVIARTRPSRDEEVPAEVSDTYTELIGVVNETVDALKSGDITVAAAVKATSADKATSAENASSAAYAISAGSALSAGKASYDHLGDLISTKYASFKDELTALDPTESIAEGTYQVSVYIDTGWYSTIMTVVKDKEVMSNLGWSITTGKFTAYAVQCPADTTSLVLIDSNGYTHADAVFYIRRINVN